MHPEARKATGRVALIAGQGVLPPLLAQRLEDPFIASLEGFPPEGLQSQPFRLEQLVPFMDLLAEHGVSKVCFAGAVRRPRLDPEAFDPRTASLVPRILAAMQSGDDAALRVLMGLFEEFGFEIVAATHIAPDLIAEQGILTGNPTASDRDDVARAAAIVDGLGKLDLGQGAIVAQGLCLAVETLPGTDAMLEFVATHRNAKPNPKRARGVIYKAPKPDQSLQIDLPAIGPETVRLARKAGLAGIAWQAGGVMLLERERTLAAARDAEIFLWARPQGDR